MGEKGNRHLANVWGTLTMIGFLTLIIMLSQATIFNTMNVKSLLLFITFGELSKNMVKKVGPFKLNISTERAEKSHQNWDILVVESFWEEGWLIGRLSIDDHVERQQRGNIVKPWPPIHNHFNIIAILIFGTRSFGLSHMCCLLHFTSTSIFGTSEPVFSHLKALIIVSGR